MPFSPSPLLSRADTIEQQVCAALGSVRASKSAREYAGLQLDWSNVILTTRAIMRIDGGSASAALHEAVHYWRFGGPAAYGDAGTPVRERTDIIGYVMSAIQDGELAASMEAQT